MTKIYDALIIGAGIMGCSTAFQLAKRGLKVAVLEKTQIGAGSSGKSSAIIRQHYSNKLTARMALHSLRVFQNFAEVVGGESGFTQTGFVVLVAAADRDGLEANVALQREIGINTQLISPQTLQDMMPGLQINDLVTAAYEAEGGYADPHLTVNAYATAARNLGAKIFLDTEVTAIRFNGNKVIGVDTPKQSLDAPLVLNCAGPWGAHIANMIGLQIPINPCRVQVTFLRRPTGYEAAHPVVGDFINATYFRSETGNLTLLGLIDPTEANAIVNPDAYNEALDSTFILEAGERLVNRYPIMEQAQSTGGYAALYAITPDWHPIIDEVPTGSGFFICAGFSGHGFKLGPAVGLMAADMLTKASNPKFDPHTFRLSRYVEDNPVKGQYDYSIIG